MNDTMGWRQLYDLKLDALEECQAAWARTAEVAGEAEDDADRGIERLSAAMGEFDDAAWNSRGKEAAKSRGSALRNRFDEAGTEANAVSAVLTGAVDRLREVRTSFRDYVDSIESDDSASSQGGGNYVVDIDKQLVHPPTPPPEVAQHPDAVPHWDVIYREDAASYRNVLEEILAEARDIDDNVCGWLLNHSANHTEFNGEAIEEVPSVREAKEAADEAVDKIEDALAGGDLSDDEIAEINDQLASYEDNPYFAHQLMDRLGPNGLADLAGLAQGDPTGSGPSEEGEELLDKLGGMLATGTDPSNEPHLGEEWNEQFRQLGVEEITVGEGGDDQYTTYGYEALAPLLGRGDEFHPDFIVPVSEHLLGLTAHTAEGQYPAFEAALTGLGHSPDAAREFFSPGAREDGYPGYHPDEITPTVDDPLDYFINDCTDVGIIHPEIVGGALEAAATGFPPGSDLEEVMNSETTPEEAEFTNRLVEMVSENSERFKGEVPDEHFPSGLIDNLGNITAAHASEFYRDYLPNPDHDWVPRGGASLDLAGHNDEWMSVLGHSEYASAITAGSVGTVAEDAALDASLYAEGSEVETVDALMGYADVISGLGVGADEAMTEEVLQSVEDKDELKSDISAVTGPFDKHGIVGPVLDHMIDTNPRTVHNELLNLYEESGEKRNEQFFEAIDPWIEELAGNADNPASFENSLENALEGRAS